MLESKQIFCYHDHYNQETVEAMREAEEITCGKFAVKTYASAEELFLELDQESDKE